MRFHMVQQIEQVTSTYVFKQNRLALKSVGYHETFEMRRASRFAMLEIEDVSVAHAITQMPEEF